MSEIHISTTIDVPWRALPGLAESYVASLWCCKGDATVPMTFRIGNRVVQREVRLAIIPGRRYGASALLEIRWTPVDGGLYPDFRGRLCAAQITRTNCRLHLDGAYKPPLSILGEAFDAAIGRHVALECARSFLEHFKAALEKDYGAIPA